MINANELRIGNWFMKDGYPCQVTDLTTVFYYLDDLNPIPLTPEILEKCGFVKQQRKTAGGFTMYYGYKLHLFVDDWENPFSNITATWERHLHCNDIGRYPDMKLHQLQNLYFALTGKELEIKL